jgi:hypothetical protein
LSVTPPPSFDPYKSQSRKKKVEHDRLIKLTMSADTKEMKKYEKWTKSLQYITGLGLSETEKKEFKSQLDKDLEEYQCKQCEVWKDNLIKNSK